MSLDSAPCIINDIGLDLSLPKDFKLLEKYSNKVKKVGLSIFRDFYEEYKD